jgi:deoxyribonuclease IV
MLIGAHVRDNDPLTAARETGSECIQIFVGDPQSWKLPAGREDAAEIKASGIPIYVHSPYVVNLASPDNKIRIPSRKVLQGCCDQAAEVGARAVIVHGGHVRSADDLDEGFARWKKALDQLETDVPIYLENTAGGDHAMARRWEVLDRLWSVIGDDPRMGFCLDTCHTHASGEELAEAVDRVLAITGRIDLVHCNGSRDGEGTGKDRHQNFSVLGTDNQVSPRLLVELVAKAGAPVICETPDVGLASDVTFLRDAVATMHP